MRDEIVALDLETTGLDFHNDAIIEVGAVRMREGEVIAEYSTMVNPDIPIPTQTTHITGISQEDVVKAPQIQTVLPQISEFIGNAPIIAHNITLDMGFLQQRHGIVRGNKSIDTYDLATILLPSAPRYNLNSLTHQVGIELENAHRALDDARAAGLLYWKLWERVLQLPHNVLQEISTAAQGLDWGTSIVFTAALRESTTSSRDLQLETKTLFSPLSSPSTPLHGDNEERKTLDLKSIEDFFGEGGQLSQQIDGYEQRPQQIEMAHAITEAFNNSQHLIVEADTGTGKSLAYLLPAVLWATRNNRRVVVSTNTINLQDQLMHKDIPALQAALDIDFKAAVMKGRDNYLCPRRLNAARRRPPASAEELITLAKILVWLLESQSGDRGEINLRGPVERTVWQRLSAYDEGCSLKRCEGTMNGTCPFYKARKAADSAHVVIVNHALLISDAKTDNRVLPDYHYLVVDEAHHLEDAITYSLTFRIDEPALQRRIGALGTPNRGLFGEILKSLQPHISEKEHKKLSTFIQNVSDANQVMGVHIQKLFESIRHFITGGQDPRNMDYLTLLRIDTKHRNQSNFSQVQSRWNTLEEFFDVISNSMQQLSKALHKTKNQDIPNHADLIDSVETAARYLADIRTHMSEFILKPDDNMIYWFGLSQGSDNPTMQSAPLHIGTLVEKYLWHDKDSVVLTGATLRTQEQFTHIQDRLFAEKMPTKQIASVFDYEKSTLIYLPDDIPAPNQRNAYQRAVERGIIELADALQGRVLVLFTSYTQLRQTSQAITPRLMLGDIVVYDQSDGTSREALLEGFKTTDKAVLLGTKSFWEGIDIPGESLSALVIVRLPFAVPSDPIFSARSETYNDSFREYAVPDAILRFRQGFGRLIRSATDRGIVTVFDSRILTKKYGQNFLEALPNCTVQSGSLDNLPETARKWLNEDA